jgi:hypothetical protein
MSKDLTVRKERLRYIMKQTRHSSTCSKNAIYLPVIIIILLRHGILPRQQGIRQAPGQTRRWRITPAAV